MIDQWRQGWLAVIVGATPRNEWVDSNSCCLSNDVLNGSTGSWLRRVGQPDQAAVSRVKCRSFGTGKRPNAFCKLGANLCVVVFRENRQGDTGCVEVRCRRRKRIAAVLQRFLRPFYIVIWTAKCGTAVDALSFRHNLDATTSFGGLA
jgi:hypothetical protein